MFLDDSHWANVHLHYREPRMLHYVPLVGSLVVCDADAALWQALARSRRLLSLVVNSGGVRCGG